MVARFVAMYGAAAFWGPGWPTTDGAVPWALFLELLVQLPRLEAAARVTTALGVTHALGTAFADADHQRAADPLHRDFALAYPETAAHLPTPALVKNRARTEGDG